MTKTYEERYREFECVVADLIQQCKDARNAALEEAAACCETNGIVEESVICAELIRKLKS